jgi:uncharacterized protein YjbJ (UPF0337 family)
MEKTKEIILGKWLEIKGQVQHWWGRLIDDDLIQLRGINGILTEILRQR